TRTYRLADGSVVTLNTGTHLRYAYARGRRHVVLDGGEAFFEGAHDAAKPFVVSVGERDVVAVGTAFDISYLQDSSLQNRATVSVTEGVVRVSGKRDFLGGATDGTGVPAGTWATYAPNSSVYTGKTMAILDIAAWRRGLLVYRDRTVREILSDLSR